MLSTEVLICSRLFYHFLILVAASFSKFRPKLLALHLLIIQKPVILTVSTALMALAIKPHASDAIIIADAWLIRGWLALNVVIDVVIAIALACYLGRHKTGFARCVLSEGRSWPMNPFLCMRRSQLTSFDSTDTMINRLIRYALETGAITSYVPSIPLSCDNDTQDMYRE